ncbi:MAG: YCF48-related protein [Bacteroidia bacterium]|nr:YCF48-related protein [Bacteroidia bacterium]
MKSLFLVIAVFLTSTFAPLLRAQWQWCNPVPQSNDLWNTMFAPNSGTGWAVGGAGMILKSVNAGTSWQPQTTLREDFFRGVCAVDAQVAWIVGDNGVVLRTVDGGASWQSQNSGTTAGINVIHAVSASSAWFVGDSGMLHATTDGGVTWISRSTGTTNNLNAVFFTGAMNGVAVGSANTIIRSTDGGVTWSPVYPPGMNSDLLGLFFINAQYGWASGTGGRILRTTNGGQSWQGTNSGTSQDINRLVFIDTQNGWAAGEGGTLLRTTNGGSLWTPVNSGTVNGLEGIAVSGSTVIAVGLFGDILRSSNGSTFTMVTVGTRSTLNAVSTTPSHKAWAVGSDGTIITTNGLGQPWQQVASGSIASLFAVDNIGGSTVVACGNGGVILRSTNAGTSWSQVAGGGTVALNGIDLLDNGIGYIVGGSGRVLKTTNGGAGWYTVASGTLQPLFGVHFTDADNGTIVGAGGTILSTTNGGYTWSSQQGWTQDALFSVIRDGSDGMICGDGGEAIFTTDGGVHWTSLILPTTVPLFRLVHPSPNEYAAVGEAGVIMRTSDNGQTWVREISHAMHTMYGADAHGGVVYAVGDVGQLLYNASYPYPVELLSFTGRHEGDCVRIEWETLAETAHFGTELQRAIQGEWASAAFFPTRGLSGGRYAWRDCDDLRELRRYRLKSIGTNGEISFSRELVVPALPSHLDFDAWPQPSGGDVHIRLRETTEETELTVLDALGRIVHKVSPDRTAALESVNIPASAFPSAGVYTLILHSAAGASVKHVVVLR